MTKRVPIGVAYEPIIDLSTDRPILMQALPRLAPDAQTSSRASGGSEAEPESSDRARDMHVLKLACEELAGWAASGLEVGVCVPVDAATLGDVAFPNDVERLATEVGFDLRRLQFGLTPAALAGAYSMRNAASLRDKGVTLCLLDLGIGFHSMHSLNDLPCERAEVAASFITALERGDQGHGVAGMTALFRLLGIRAGAAGVATASTLGSLSDLGIQTARGPAICDPMGPAIAHHWLLQECRRRGGQD